ncbi:MAG TPA: hypothetical protein VFE31_15825 [Opitutaceae bacterium]|jgi:hypothetical protein|nr:hypothetical protein [Opitutaceae bacterium]
MRVILDECLPRKLGAEIVGHDVTTVPKAGFASIVNGTLLQQLDGKFDAFVTVDKSIPSQQKTRELSFGILILRARSNRLADLKPLVPQILSSLHSVGPGQVVVIAPPAARS